MLYECVLLSLQNFCVEKWCDIFPLKHAGDLPAIALGDLPGYFDAASVEAHYLTK